MRYCALRLKSEALPIIEISFKLTDFERAARQMQASLGQVPFALSLALNSAADHTRRVLTEQTWPESVKVINRGFISYALRYQSSTKRDLRIEIYDQVGRGNLRLHADGGTISPKSAARLTIPPEGLFKRGPHGVPPAKRAKAIIANTPKRALRVTNRGIFVGKKGKLHLMYVFKQRAVQPKDVLFREDFNYSMRADVRTSFPLAMKRAMGWK